MKGMSRKKSTIAAMTVFAAASAVAFADEGGRKFSEFLNGFKEASAIVSTSATGKFKATISRDGTEINYELTFNNLEGDVRQAHIHIGHPQNQGNIVLWLCDSSQNPSPFDITPLCNSNDVNNNRSNTVTGTLTEADIAATALANGIDGATEAEFAEVVALIKAGLTYVNVHSAKFGGGEIRSQLDNRGNNNNEHRGDH
jgi:hypothetical protein